MVMAGMGVAVVMRMLMVVSMLVSAVVATGGVGAVLGFKGFVHGVHDQVHGTQHVGQHMVWLNLQVVGLQFDGHVAVAQVVGRANQVEGRAMLAAVRDFQHCLWRGLHLDQRAVFGHQHITTAHGRAARQKNPESTAGGIGSVKAAFLAHVPVQLHRGSALEQNRSQALALGNAFGDLEHKDSDEQGVPALWRRHAGFGQSKRLVMKML